MGCGASSDASEQLPRRQWQAASGAQRDASAHRDGGTPGKPDTGALQQTTLARKSRHIGLLGFPRSVPRTAGAPVCPLSAPSSPPHIFLPGRPALAMAEGPDMTSAGQAPAPGTAAVAAACGRCWGRPWRPHAGAAATARPRPGGRTALSSMAFLKRCTLNPLVALPLPIRAHVWQRAHLIDFETGETILELLVHQICYNLIQMRALRHNSPAHHHPSPSVSCRLVLQLPSHRLPRRFYQLQSGSRRSAERRQPKSIGPGSGPAPRVGGSRLGGLLGPALP